MALTRQMIQKSREEFEVQVQKDMEQALKDSVKSQDANLIQNFVASINEEAKPKSSGLTVEQT